MRTIVLAALAAAAAAVWAAPGHAVERRKEPALYKHRFGDANFSNRCYSCQQRVTWRVSDRPYATLGRLDPRKTAACRRGTFLPRVHAQYVVAAWDGDLDVAWGKGINLLDGERLARPEEVYLFLEAGYIYNGPTASVPPMTLSQECEVYVRTDDMP